MREPLPEPAVCLLDVEDFAPAHVDIAFLALNPVAGEALNVPVGDAEVRVLFQEGLS